MDGRCKHCKFWHEIHRPANFVHYREMSEKRPCILTESLYDEGRFNASSAIAVDINSTGAVLYVDPEHGCVMFEAVDDV